MTNYNERLDEIFAPLIDSPSLTLTTAYWDEAKQALTSLIKELVEEAKPPEEQTGGLTEIYSQDGQYNKSYYAILANPGISKISKQFTTLTRYYHKVNLSKIAPKIVPIKYKKEVGSDVV